MNVFCLPFAGGSASAYRGLQDIAAPGLNVVPLELPGRGRRFNVPLCCDLQGMADDLFGQLRGSTDQPYVFFGHSMGAWLAYLLTRRVLLYNCRPPARLVVSGWKGPSAENSGRFHLLPREEFFKMLKELGGCPEAVLAERELMELCEPIIRADFQAVETYRHTPGPPFDIPIAVLGGRADREVSEPDLQLWAKETTAGVSYHFFPGGHFYIFDQWPAIAGIVSAQA